RFSRSRVYAKRALHKHKKEATIKAETVKPEAATKTVQVKGDKNGGSRVVPVKKASNYYPAEDVKKPKTARKAVRVGAVRSSITPGTVLIMLAGRFRGKRVVFLKQLEQSGLLLVTGPFKVNGVPLRRINQAYVIATSTKVDISGVDVSKFDDKYFKREAEARLKGTEEEFFGEKAAKKAAPAHKVADQKEVDKAIIATIKKTPMLQSYLNSSFSLSKGQAPHLMKF
ncbi:hypothetical protein GQ42DRAFT_164135, partial [Ramicandelaber brevisporus]